MNIEEIEQEISVMQLSDSFFPTGIFATSNGLEFLFLRKKIQGTRDIIHFIKTCMTQQIGPLDCIALANGCDNAKKNDFEKIIEVDNVVFASKTIKEIREASVRSGIQLVKCVTEFVKNDKILNQYQMSIKEGKAYGVFPVAFAVCCNALKITKEKSMIMMTYGFTVGIVGAALRLGMIQHFEGQKIIHEIKPVIGKTIEDFSDKSILEIWQFAPQLDIFQMTHEKMDSKMFIT